MYRKVPPKIYWPATPKQVEAQLRKGEVPAAFVRRMRTINMLSAATLMKIEDAFLDPFDVMDVHHVLDRLISQDAIIDQLASDELSFALTTGNIRPLWDIAEASPLLLKGLTSGWISLFINEPFDPLCVMLAMRAKAMLDLIDEEGKSYNLMRKLGFGFIDLGEIEGEEPGDPGDYYPPEIDNPIDGDPEYTPPGPTEPGYVPGTGEPGYTEPGDVPPGTGGGGPGGGAPWGFETGPGDLGGYVSGSGSAPPVGGDPCEDVDDPEATVTIGYTTQSMQVEEEQELTVEGAHPRWSGENYTWLISAGGGTLSAEYGLSVIYTAPETNAECESNPTIEMWCGEALMSSLRIAVNAYTTDKNAFELKEVTGDAGVCCAYLGHSCQPGATPPDCSPVEDYCGVKTYFMITRYNCAGEERYGCDEANPFICAYTSPDGVWELKGRCIALGAVLLGQDTPLGATDMRTALMITEGCCPEDLL